jgi:hypothetical protein
MLDFQMPPYDLYKILGVDPESRVKVIRYHANLLLRSKRPSKYGNTAEANEEFDRILRAKKILEDQPLRRLYDRARELELSGTPWTLASLTSPKRRKKSTADGHDTDSSHRPKRQRISREKKAPGLLKRDLYRRYEDFKEGECEMELRNWASNVFDCYRHEHQHHHRAEKNGEKTVCPVSTEHPRFFELISDELLETVKGQIVEVATVYREVEMQCGDNMELLNAAEVAKQKIIRKSDLLIHLQGHIDALKTHSGTASPMEECLRIAGAIDRVEKQLAEIWGVIDIIKGSRASLGLRDTLRVAQNKNVDDDGRHLQKTEREMCIEQFVLLLESIEN